MKSLLLAGAAVCLMAIPALAQVSQNDQHSTSGSDATAVIENNNPGLGAGYGGGSGGGYYGAHGNNVDAVAPTIYSNNVCALSVAGSASFLGIGVGAGFNSVDRHCDDRATEIIMLTAAQKMNSPVLSQWAINIMCKDNAATAPEGVCTTAAAPASPVAMTISPAASRPMAYPAAPSPASVQPLGSTPAASRPDWCDTWSKGDGLLPAACH